MAARESWGHTTIYADGTVDGKTDAPKVASYYFSENDEGRFVRLGPERMFHLTMAKDATLQQLEDILSANQNIASDFRCHAERMIEQGKIYDGNFETD